MSETTAPIAIRYQFAFANGERKEFVVQLDPETLQLLQPPRASFPAWTQLSHCKCPNCPLNDEQSPQCPAAVSLIDIVEFFGASQSIEQVEVRVEVAERAYQKRCALQEVVSSLVGLCMATSGCPVMAKLRPMARCHLPFATIDDTRYRALSMYLLGQYLIARRGAGTPDWDLTRFVKWYEDIVTVNAHFFKRFHGLGIEDASLNAIVRLDAFAGTIAFTVNEHILDELERLFQAYLEPPPT